MTGIELAHAVVLVVLVLVWSAVVGVAVGRSLRGDS